MCRWIVAVCVVVGCAGREPAPEGTTGPASAPTPIVSARGAAPIVSPHTGRISLVAATDRGDAAISSDNQGGLRLWPALDGTREPVLVHAAEPRQMAIGPNADGLVAALVDGVGGVDILRFDGDGGLLDRVQLPAEPIAEEVAVVDGYVLVRRGDQSIARYAPNGTLRGRLVGEPKQRLVGLAVRRGAVLVGIGDADRAVTARFLDVEPFAWGAAVTLPVPLSELALAPGRARIAGVAADRRATIVDLRPTPVVAGSFDFIWGGLPRGKGDTRAEPPVRPVLGFVDDDHLTLSAPRVQWADRARGWKPDRGDDGDADAHASIGDVAVFGRGAGLGLGTPGRTRSLGYRTMGSSHAALSDGLRIIRGSHETLWLDDKLRLTHTLPDDQLGEHHGAVGPSPSPQFALDDRHVLVTRSESYEYRGKQFVEIRDLVAKKSTRIGELDRGHSYNAFDRGTGVAAFRTETAVWRFQVDTAAGTGKPLRSLSGAKDDLLPIHLTDPALAGGICAIVAPVFERGIVKVFRVPADGDAPGPPIEPARVKIDGNVIGVDRAANVYVLGPTADVVVYALASAASPPPVKLPIGSARLGAASDDGENLAFVVTGGVAGFDRRGAKRWFTPMDAATSLGFRGDTVIAAGASGYLLLSAKTGERIGSACAWGFGIYDRYEVDAAPNVPSTCADGR